MGHLYFVFDLCCILGPRVVLFKNVIVKSCFIDNRLHIIVFWFLLIKFDGISLSLSTFCWLSEMNNYKLVWPTLINFKVESVGARINVEMKMFELPIQYRWHWWRELTDSVWDRLLQWVSRIIYDSLDLPYFFLLYLLQIYIKFIHFNFTKLINNKIPDWV